MSNEKTKPRLGLLKPGDRDLLVDLYEDDKLEDVRYGRWREAKDGAYLVPSYLSGSDYSGSLVQKSNYKKWQDDFEDGYEKWWTAASGGHGTYSIVIDIQNVPEDREEEVAEFLNGLNDYPLADEELHSEMEMEAQNEAWDNWGRKDFIRALEKKFDVELDEVDPEKIFELFSEKSESTGTYWENESGDSMYINMDRIVKAISKKDVEEITGS